jgi:hypothetical protein
MTTAPLNAEEVPAPSSFAGETSRFPPCPRPLVRCADRRVPVGPLRGQALRAGGR